MKYSPVLPTLLVVGDQDISRLEGHKKSSKHRKAEELITKGLPIRKLRESDFKELARLSNEITQRTCLDQVKNMVKFRGIIGIQPLTTDAIISCDNVPNRIPENADIFADIHLRTTRDNKGQ